MTIPQLSLVLFTLWTLGVLIGALVLVLSHRIARRRRAFAGGPVETHRQHPLHLLLGAARVLPGLRWLRVVPLIFVAAGKQALLLRQQHDVLLACCNGSIRPESPPLNIN